MSAWTHDKQLREELIRDEGWRGTPYVDTQGNPTIGVGRLLAKGLSANEIMLLLVNDVYDAEQDLDNNLPHWRQLTARRQRALLNMCFNLGINRLLGFKKMLRALWEKDYETAASEALDSKWAQQVGERAERIAAMLKEG